MNDPCVRPIHFIYTPATATVKEETNQGPIQFRLCTRCANELEAMHLSIIRIVYDSQEPYKEPQRIKRQVPQ